MCISLNYTLSVDARKQSFVDMTHNMNLYLSIRAVQCTDTQATNTTTTSGTVLRTKCVYFNDVKLTCIIMNLDQIILFFLIGVRQIKSQVWECVRCV